MITARALLSIGDDKSNSNAALIVRTLEQDYPGKLAVQLLNLEFMSRVDQPDPQKYFDGMSRAHSNPIVLTIRSFDKRCSCCTFDHSKSSNVVIRDLPYRYSHIDPMQALLPYSLSQRFMVSCVVSSRGSVTDLTVPT